MVTSDSHVRSVLACDDEPHILGALKIIFREAGYHTLTATNVAEALEIAAVSPLDAAVIDLVLPDGSGIELCRRLRESSDIPIVVVSAISEEGQKLEALNAGADDYVTKPFSPRELLARLAALLRPVSPEASTSILTCDGLEIDPTAHVVRRDGQQIDLTRTEFELLHVLARNRGRLVTHRTLLSEVWGPGYAVDTHVLRTHIARLRRKLESHDGVGWPFVRTDPGVGFRFGA